MSLWSIIVTFQPDLDRLEVLLRAIRPQVEGIVVADNGPDDRISGWLAARRGLAVKLLVMGGNLGVAAAHNAGIAEARRQGATRVLLFDQDSHPAPDMVSRLDGAFATASRCGLNVASAGPRFHDPRDGRVHPFIRLNGWRVQRVTKPDRESFCTADYLITSGCLISLDALDAVGGLDESLFIDYVDIEWGLRARSRGYVHLGVFDARMEHPLGDPPLQFLAGRLRVPMHSPTRHYYHFRNAVTLYRRSYAPRVWVLHDAAKLPLKMLFYSLFVKDGARQRRAIFRGLIDGVRGRLGCAPADLHAVPVDSVVARVGGRDPSRGR